MEPNENLPGGPANRTVTIQLTRDTLVLIAALSFLALAILLAVIFPTENSSSERPFGTAIAQNSPVATPARQATQEPAIDSEYPAPVASATPLPNLTPAPVTTPATSLAEPLGEYPAPATPTPFGDATPTINLLGPSVAPFVPTFQPDRPTQAPAGGAPTATFDPFFDQSTPEPPDLIATPTEEFFDDEEDQEAPPFEDPPFPTAAPVAPQLPRQTEPPSFGQPDATPSPLPLPTVPPPPTSIPTEVLRGQISWTAAQSPIVLTRDHRLAAGASLLIEPGVEVRLAPGVSFFIEGTLYGLGQPGRPVRFVGAEGQRWEGLFGRPGSDIALEHTEIRGGGASGTVLMSEGGNLALRNVRINDNGGHIYVAGSRLELRDSEIAGNDMPYGAALEATYSAGGNVILINNRIGGNRMSAGAAPVQINNQSPFDPVTLEIQRNLLIGQDGPDLVLFTNGPLQGGMTCNALMNGANGLSVRSETPQVPGFALTVRDNAIEDHTPPIIPIYLEYGIGRGATSEIALDMRNNWWNSPLGPYEPDRHADGRGEAVGENIDFAPWLAERPACAPAP